MKRQMILGGRRTGKTTQLINLSAENGRYILVRNMQEASQIAKLANELGVNIPYPITVQEIVVGKLEGSSVLRDGLYVDNALDVLEQILGTEIVTASILIGETK